MKKINLILVAALTKLRFLTISLVIALAATTTTMADPIADVIKNAATVHRIVVETTLADQYCPMLKLDKEARTKALVKLLGREDRVAVLGKAFGDTEQADAFIQHKAKMFKSKITAERNVACEWARLAFGVGGGIADGVLIPR